MYSLQHLMYSMQAVSIDGSWLSGNRAGTEIPTGHSNFLVDALLLDSPHKNKPTQLTKSALLIHLFCHEMGDALQQWVVSQETAVTQGVSQ